MPWLGRIHALFACRNRRTDIASAPKETTVSHIGLAAIPKGKMCSSHSRPFKLARCSKSASNPTKATIPRAIPATVYVPCFVIGPNLGIEGRRSAPLSNGRLGIELVCAQCARPFDLLVFECNLAIAGMRRAKHHTHLPPPNEETVFTRIALSLRGDILQRRAEMNAVAKLFGLCIVKPDVKVKYDRNYE